MIYHRFYLVFLLAFYGMVSAFGQGLKIEVLSAEPAGTDNDYHYFSMQFKVVSGKAAGDGTAQPLALLQPNGTYTVAYLENFAEVGQGQKSRTAANLKLLGNVLKPGQQLVSPELAMVKMPNNRSFECKTGYAFVEEDPTVFFTTISGVKGHAKVGDEVAYTTDRGQKGSGVILGFQVTGGYKPDHVFEGIVNNDLTIRVKTNGVDLSNAVLTLGKMVPAAVHVDPPKASKAKHRVKTIPVEAVLEDKLIKITVHNLVKFNPDSTDKSFDIFKVDYALDYYIVDATIENKTDQPLDAGDYLLRFNFFTADGKSADEFLRVFREGKTSGDPAMQDANKVDINVFGGTSKLPLAGVLVKYQETLPDYDTKHKPQTDALNKPLAARQKVRSVEASIMGVPPSYRIEGIGTWGGTFYDKKKVLFQPLKL